MTACRRIKENPHNYNCSQLQKLSEDSKTKPIYIYIIYVCIYITLAGVWIHMAGLRRMWSHNCLSRGIPFCRLLRYFENARQSSSTALLTWDLEDWKKKKRSKVTTNTRQSKYIKGCQYQKKVGPQTMLKVKMPQRLNATFL